MRPSSYDIPLHDIKPLMEVTDYSLTFLGIVSGMAVLLLSGALYLAYRFVRNRQRVNLRKVHYEALEKVDFADPKKAAYAVTLHGRVFAEDSEPLREAYNNLVERLERYKYKKRVEPIDDDSRSYYKIYLEMIDV